jgi:hypothetical protein
MKELEIIQRGELAQELYPYIEEWVNKKIQANIQSLENRDFSDLLEVYRLQDKQGFNRDFKHILERWIKEKDKILDKRRKDNSR